MLALGSRRAEGKLQIAADSANNTLFSPKAQDATAIDVRVETLDNFILENVPLPIQFIKIDVEGWELEVLKGGTELLMSKNAPVICIEYPLESQIEGGGQPLISINLSPQLINIGVIN